jgi:hypothetical protein
MCLCRILNLRATTRYQISSSIWVWSNNISCKFPNDIILKPQVGKNYAFGNFTGDIDGAQPQYQS